MQVFIPLSICRKSFSFIDFFVLKVGSVINLSGVILV